MNFTFILLNRTVSSTILPLVCLHLSTGLSLHGAPGSLAVGPGTGPVAHSLVEEGEYAGISPHSLTHCFIAPSITVDMRGKEH